MFEPKGEKCTNGECENKRRKNDTTGFCLECRRTKGLVEPKKAKKVVAQEDSPTYLEKAFNRMLSIDQPAIIAAVKVMWPKLSHKDKVLWLETILDEAANIEHANTQTLNQAISDAIDNNNTMANKNEYIT